MRIDGPGSDEEGRQFVLDHRPENQNPVFPPDLFVLSADRELLGRLPYDASADETLALLQDVLKRRPDLAPTTPPLDELRYDDDDPAQSELASIVAQWSAGERLSLLHALEE